MGSLRNYPRDRYIMEPAEALLPSALLSSMPAFMSVGLGHAPSTPPTKPTPPLVAPENTKCDPLGNVSMDSGIAGLRDQGSASPPNWHPANHAHSPRSPAIVQPLMANINNNVHASHKTTSSRDKELPEFIVDRITRTTYRKGKFLGKGGFARVHELTDLTTGRIYAGKIIPKARITKPHHRDKIVREIELHRPLVHPQVVRFYHCFEDDDNVYIILENCPSKSLVHVMKHRGMLTEPEVRYYIRQLGEGLRYVHQSGVVHRDLKLGNMFLSQDLQVKIGDFGLAARRDPQAKVTICGTPNYIAPEVLNKKGHGYEADLWAMGCIMYAMLVGQPPFETSSLEETYQRILHNQYHLPSHISPAAAHVIRRLLAPRRSQRMTLEQLLHSEFLTQGFLPTTLPSSSTLVSPTFPQPPRETNLRSGHSHAHLERGIEAGGGRDRSESSKTCVNRSRPESLKLMSPSSKEKLGRSQSLRESSQKKEREREREREKEQEKEKVQLPVTLRQRLSSVILGVGRDRSRERNVMTVPPVSLSARALYQALDDCLCVAPHALCNPSLAHCSPLFISKWIDYSNKYGFGFQLSDHTVGVLFNDACRITLDSDRNRVDFEDRDGSTSNFNYNSPPVTLKSRSTLLRYFTQYMDENLTEGGDGQSGGKEGRKKSVHMKRWVRTPKAIIMQMDNGTLQINFFKDHTKVVLWWNRDGYNVTYINSDRLGSTYRLVDIMTQGCEPSLRERLLYALTVLREFAELDQVSSPTSPHV